MQSCHFGVFVWLEMQGLGLYGFGCNPSASRVTYELRSGRHLCASCGVFRLSALCWSVSYTLASGVLSADVIASAMLRAISHYELPTDLDLFPVLRAVPR